MAEATTFQFASTAFTMTVNGFPDAAAVGVPVFPVVVAGAASSPGSRSWSWLTAPGATVNAALVPVIAATAEFFAVIKTPPAAFINVRFDIVIVPLTKFPVVVGVPAAKTEFVTLNAAVPVNDVSVLLVASCAVILMASDVPAT